MEAIIFCGIQASGKSTYYKEHFFRTHVRIAMDLLQTRRKERLFLETCLSLQQRFVVDNTNPTAKDRQGYILKAKDYKFKVICYFFETTVGEAITRNKTRIGKQFVPAAGIGGTFKKLQPPVQEEGFDEIYKVCIVDGEFKTELMFPKEDT